MSVEHAACARSPRSSTSDRLVGSRRWAATLGALALGLAASTARADDKPGANVVATIKTVKSRADISAALVKPAEQAADKRDWKRAIPLYQAVVVARGPASPEARKLASLWTLAGQRDEAIKVLREFVAATDDPAAMNEAKAEIGRLEKNADPFGKQFETAALVPEATKAFKAGRAAFAAKQYGDALVYYTMGYALAPDLPGFLRELGATYEKVGAKDRKIDFYREYLLRRPFGKNADEVRKDLAGEKNVLGTLTVSSSLPCDQVWLNRQPLPGKLPKKDLALPPGTYKALCLNNKYEIAMFEYATVSAGQSAQLSFNWAILVNALDAPLGRISIENPKSPGVMLDLGISNPEVGVVVPADGRALRMVLKDDSGSKVVERFQKLTPGQRVVVKW